MNGRAIINANVKRGDSYNSAARLIVENPALLDLAVPVACGTGLLAGGGIG